MTSESIHVLYAIITSAVVGFQIYRVARIWRQIRDNPAPPEVREKSHAVANEAAKVQAQMHEISEIQLFLKKD